jgi:hypothetical protein
VVECGDGLTGVLKLAGELLERGEDEPIVVDLMNGLRGVAFVR